MNHATASLGSMEPFPPHAKNVALKETTRLAVSVNSKHRDVQRLERTAKEIAAEIGEELIKVKAGLKLGEFMPWVKTECSFTDRHAQSYIPFAGTNRKRVADFERCDRIRDVLTLTKPPKPSLNKPVQLPLTTSVKWNVCGRLGTTLARLKGECENAQRKLNEIEKEIGPVGQTNAAGKSPRMAARKTACAIMDKLSPIMKPKVRPSVIRALVIAYGDAPQKLDELLTELTKWKAA